MSDRYLEKIKVTISSYDYNILKKDLVNFDMGKRSSIGSLCNYLIKYYRLKEFNKITKKIPKNHPKETLNISIQEDQKEKICTDIGKLGNAEYLKYLIYNYLDNSPIEREKILNKEKFEFINQFINQKKIFNKFNSYSKEYIKILPIAIIGYEPEGRSYLLNFYVDKKEFKCLQIKNFIIKDYEEMDEEITLKNEYLTLAKDLEKNFDPFLTFGHTVKVKFTENGKEIYKKTVHNKPKLLEKDETNGTYIFQCTEFLGKLYFGQFLDDVEILEPESLRTYFKEKSQKIFALYNEENK